MTARSAIRAGRRGDRGPIEAFPVLGRVRAGSPAYIDEDLWLAPTEVAELLAEFARLRGACARLEFVAGLDTEATWSAWQNGTPQGKFNEWLNRIESLLRQAVDGGWWVRLML